MDQRIILAVAGSGKTSYIVDSISPESANLVITFTHNNYKNLLSRVVSRFEGIPPGSRIYKYFSFLYSFCLRPLCGDKYDVRGVSLDIPPEYTRRIRRDDLRHYTDSSRRIYVSRIASFLINFGLVDEVRERIVKYFDKIYVDEVQDFAAYDFNLLLDMASENIDSVFVGDFFQHTYDTSRDGNVNQGLHKYYSKYCETFENRGFEIDNAVLSNSYRCSHTTCKYVSENLGIAINSHQIEETVLEFVDDEEWAEAIFHQDHIVKLFYQSHHRFPCFSDNWGASKGVDDYDSVCVVLNKKSESLFRESKMHELPPTTKNKLYVACTRARSELFFVPERFYSKYKQ